MTDFHDLQQKEQLLLQQKWEDDVDVDEGNVCDLGVHSVTPNKFFDKTPVAGHRDEPGQRICRPAATFLSALFLHEKKRTALDADQSQVTKSAKNFGGWLVGFEPTFTNLQNNSCTTGADADIVLIRNHVQTER